MKKEIALISMAAVMLAACSKEAEQIAPGTETVTVAPGEFSATFEAPVTDTKTSLGTDGKTVLWESGDTIAVWPGVDIMAKYALKEGAGSASATFASSETLTGTAIDKNIAYYPYGSSVGRNSNGTLSVTLPGTQQYVKDSWSCGAMPMTAATSSADDRDFALKNLAGVLRITLKGSAVIKSITVQALGEDEYLSGGATVNPETPGLQVLPDKGSKKVILDCGEGVQLSETEGTVFNIAVPAVSGGFIVDISDNAHGAMILRSASEIKRNVVLNMPETAYLANAADLGLSVKWATCNVGADSPEDYGNYYAWGETEPNGYYKWADSYKLPDNTSEKIARYKYFDAEKFYGSGGTEDNSITKYNGTDKKIVLDPEDDAASANLGLQWKTPTAAQLNELKDNCDFEEATVNGIKGYNVTGRKEGYTDASIFLPFAGRCSWSNTPEETEKFGYYASSERASDHCKNAVILLIPINQNQSKSSYTITARSNGISVRPVTDF